MSAMSSEAHATDEYKKRLSEAINQAIAHTLIDLPLPPVLDGGAQNG